MDAPTQIGPYPIERELGRGGMGIVYLGRDTRLGRAVAIKVLPALFASDPERLARFEREAKLLASLNHPNIAAIHGIEEHAGQRYLVLEYVEGPTLADRLARGALAVDEALELGRQIAAALEAAHESGVIHRDLKPGNVKVTPAGDVKVLDFGLAKGSGTADSNPDLSQSPTLTAMPTSAGVILGTAAYMSPEQARGRGVDRRTDIWSFGCVMYETFTGRQLFGGDTVSDIIARILEREPDWKAIPESVPERIREMLRRCLEKDARKRQRDIGDARIELEETLASRTSRSREAAAEIAAAKRGARGATPWLAWAVAGAAILLAAFGWLRPRGPEGPTTATRLTLQAPSGVTIANDAVFVALSPDGRTVAMVASDTSGATRLWVRPLDRLQARALPGTDNARLPFWSPDSRSIAFFADGKLKRIRIGEEDAARVICPVIDPRGGTWSRDGTIVFAPRPQGRLYAVSADGGEPRPVTVLDSTRHEVAHRFPQFLPDGRHFLYVALPRRPAGFDVLVGSLDGKSTGPILQAGCSPVFVAPGYLLYVRDRNLVARKFDPRSLTVTGDPVELPDLPGETSNSGGAVATASTGGAIAYLNRTTVTTRLNWLDREGRITGTVPIPPAEYFFSVLSPDARRILTSRSGGPSESDLWMVDAERGISTRFTYGPRENQQGSWSTDGTRIAFESNRDGPFNLYVKPANGATPETPLVENSSPFKHLANWSPDDRLVSYYELNNQTGFDLWLAPTDGSGPPRVYLQTPFRETDGFISPDGRWMCYQSDESGRAETYIQSFPEPGNKYPLTTQGSGVAFWSRDGREIIVLSPDGQSLYSSQVLETSPSFRATPPRLLFTFSAPMRGIDLARDGRRFLAALATGHSADPTVTVTQNWKVALSSRGKAGR